MNVIEKTVKILSMQRFDEKVQLILVIVEPDLVQPKEPKLENIIETVPKSETERMTREMARGFVDEFKRQGIMPTAPTMVQTPVDVFARFSLLLSREEYEALGKPTIFDELKFKLERETL